MKLIKMLASAALLFVPLSTPAVAHHSYSMFDMSKTIALEGKIVRFKWANPHAWLEIDVDVNGKVERWGIEMNSPSMLIQNGLKRTSMKPGDYVVIRAHPLRNGSKGGSFMGVKLADGSVHGQWEG